jgi:hypothetical protein
MTATRRQARDQTAIVKKVMGAGVLGVAALVAIGVSVTFLKFATKSNDVGFNLVRKSGTMHDVVIASPDLSSTALGIGRMPASCRRSPVARRAATTRCIRADDRTGWT